MTSFALRRRALKPKRTQTSVHNRQKLTQQQTRLLTQKKGDCLPRHSARWVGIKAESGFRPSPLKPERFSLFLDLLTALLGGSNLFARCTAELWIERNTQKMARLCYLSEVENPPARNRHPPRKGCTLAPTRGRTWGKEKAPRPSRHHHHHYRKGSDKDYTVAPHEFSADYFAFRFK